MSDNCHYRTDWFAADPKALVRRFDQVESGELGSELGLDDDGIESLLGQVVRVYRVPSGADAALVAAEVRRDQGIEASPIYAAGPLGHSAFMPGTKATPLGSVLSISDTFDVEKPPIAMVDTGIVPAEVRNAPWLQSGAIDSPSPEDEQLTAGVDPNEVEDSEISHGTFVASLIRRLAPEHKVFAARAGFVPVVHFKPHTEPGHVDQLVSLSSELHIAAALIRLRSRLPSAPIALNLSLGVYACDQCGSVALSLRNALRYWMSHFPTPDSPTDTEGTRIFAAGGNLKDTRPVYPAGFSFVRGVAAADCNEELQTVWEKEDHTTLGIAGAKETVQLNDWIDDVALGVDLVGYGNGEVNGSFTWSGSSFACAVATALYSRGPIPVPGNDGVTWWLSKPIECADIVPNPKQP